MKHFLEKHELFSIGDAETLYCRNCGGYEWKGQRFTDKDNAVSYIARATIKTANPLTSLRTSHRTVGNKVRAHVTAQGTIGSVEKTESHDILIHLRNQLCPLCVKKVGGYHEAVIQARGPDTEKIVAFVMKAAGTHVVGLRPGSAGTDVLLVAKGRAASVAKQLREKGYDITESFKFITEKKGTKLYRNMYAVR